VLAARPVELALLGDRVAPEDGRVPAVRVAKDRREQRVVRLHADEDLVGVVAQLRVEVPLRDAARAHAALEVAAVGREHVGRSGHVAQRTDPAHTLYSFRAGPDGARFLNTRPRADSTYITKDELVAMRKGSDAD
jgi:hypothetical protein